MRADAIVPKPVQTMVFMLEIEPSESAFAAIRVFGNVVTHEIDEM